LRAENPSYSGLDQAFSAFIGAGNLGRALANHIGFIDAGFRLTAIFDINPAIIGTVIAGLPVRDISHLEAYCQEHSVDAAILCTPKEVANATADRLVACGINAFWNFTQSDIALGHPGLVVENAHLTDGLMTLCYQVNDLMGPCRSSSSATRRVCPACRRLFLKTAQASGALRMAASMPREENSAASAGLFAPVIVNGVDGRFSALPERRAHDRKQHGLVFWPHGRLAENIQRKRRNRPWARA
jgi:hypothetical protein